MPNHVSRLARLTVCRQKIDSLLLRINAKQFGLAQIDRSCDLPTETSVRHLWLLLRSVEDATIVLKQQVEETINFERAEAAKQMKCDLSSRVKGTVSAFANVIANVEVHLLASQTTLHNVDADIKHLAMGINS